MCYIATSASVSRGWDNYNRLSVGYLHEKGEGLATSKMLNMWEREAWYIFMRS